MQVVELVEEMLGCKVDRGRQTQERVDAGFQPFAFAPGHQHVDVVRPEHPGRGRSERQIVGQIIVIGAQHSGGHKAKSGMVRIVAIREGPDHVFVTDQEDMPRRDLAGFRPCHDGLDQHRAHQDHRRKAPHEQQERRTA